MATSFIYAYCVKCSREEEIDIEVPVGFEQDTINGAVYGVCVSCEAPDDEPECDPKTCTGCSCDCHARQGEGTQ